MAITVYNNRAEPYPRTLDEGPRLWLERPVEFRERGRRGGQPSEKAEPQPLLDQRMTVLIVDDERSIAELLGEILGSVGYRVLSASNGRSALALARREHPALVLTDLMMPEVDGQELVRRLHASLGSADIPVVMMSSVRPKYEPPLDGVAPSASASVARMLGRRLRGVYCTRVDGDWVPFIEKPFDIDTVIELVNAIIQREHERTEAARNERAPQWNPDAAS